MQEYELEAEEMLLELLKDGVLMVNDHWWKEEWPEEARGTMGIFVLCSDLFAYACADAEEVSMSELKDLYKLWKADPMYGPSTWCMIKRKQMPLPQVVARRIESGYDMAALQKKYDLAPYIK